MKKIFVFFLIFLIFLTGDALVINKKNNTLSNSSYEIRGIYISYLEYLTYFENNSLSINKSYIKKMLDNIENLNLNTIFLHVSPFSDSIYNSSIFPYSYTLTGLEGKNPGMDYLEYFIKEAKKRNIKVHAWINPYRISNSSDISKISSNNPAYSLLNTNHVKVSNLGIYYNPASSLVVDLIIKQVYELITNYDIDGIHFDDYFYVDQEIDLENFNIFLENGNNITLLDYRLNIVNDMIKQVYKTIKDYDKNIIFSISPDGNILNNYELHFADIKTWLSSIDYVDIIMPQVYYGFDHETKPFIETLNEWQGLIKNDIKLVPVLAFYKVGEVDSLALSGKYEWVNNNDIIKRQINYSKTLTSYYGFSLFRYDFLFNNDLKNNNTSLELNNFKTMILESCD